MPTVQRKAAKKSKPGARRVTRSSPASRVTTPRKKKPAARRNRNSRVRVDLPKLRVRMYRQGLGDCFLLTFNPGGDEKHVLIDCGTLGSKYTDVKLPEVIAEIDKTTNGHLHLVVATHQHQDHLSGFAKLSDQFSAAENKQIDHVWLAWTENPKDQVAKKLTKSRDDMAIAVKAVGASLARQRRQQRDGHGDRLAARFFRRNGTACPPPDSAGEAIFAAAATRLHGPRSRTGEATRLSLSRGAGHRTGLAAGLSLLRPRTAARTSMPSMTPASTEARNFTLSPLSRRAALQQSARPKQAARWRRCQRRSAL